MSLWELYSPPNLRDALTFIEKEDKNVAVIASGTDLLPRIRRRLVSPGILLDISSFQEDLRYIRRSDGIVRLGALATISDILESPLFNGKLSIMREAGELFGAPQIRNVATVGGNICSAASSEDLIPVLMVLDAKVKLISSKGERDVPLGDFITGKRETAMRPSEILSEVYFQLPDGHSWTGYEKLGRRNMLILSLVNEALCLCLEEDMATVDEARLALNRVAGKIPARALKTESFLAGRMLTEETIAEARKVLASELDLTDDFRASAAYRTEVAQVYLKKLLLRCSARIRGSS